MTTLSRYRVVNAGWVIFLLLAALIDIRTRASTASEGSNFWFGVCFVAVVAVSVVGLWLVRVPSGVFVPRFFGVHGPLVISVNIVDSQWPTAVAGSLLWVVIFVLLTRPEPVAWINRWTQSPQPRPSTT
ncbi:hypothetical protein IEU95_14255 [Hoyosella rhizosphaerae]|uniref:Uncharacterized protein n=1 Tax=Hoyosella rhizosphaerae TaxID=1755582 RepID=A0A916UH15_9ACTN|nr:hypothetical protein [Hoyosella rhizosphaerae]MBN4928003.1 hypothetical protein [Hoyosella rhizosphaerae]GGC71627.1 hypothetical protein GCM10011410_25780 [Hoyosella rhizosphaerae]